MATIEKTKQRPKPKRRSMPASVGGRCKDLLEQQEDVPPVPQLTYKEPDAHILDLMLNESFTDLDLGLAGEEEGSSSQLHKDDSESVQGASAPVEASNTTPSVLLEVSSRSHEVRTQCAGREEINKALSSRDVIESLNTVKQVALLALDSLVRQLVQDNAVTRTAVATVESLQLPTRSERQRRRSFSHAPVEQSVSEFDNLPRKQRDAILRTRLLSDIAQNATRLGVTNEMRETCTDKSGSRDLATLAEIQNQLKANTPLVPSDDYSLACSLATLLGYLYRILELCEPPDASAEGSVFHGADRSAEQFIDTADDSIYSTLHKEVVNLQSRRQSLQQLPRQADMSSERVATWNEIDGLMEIIAALCRERVINEPPPRYSLAVEGDKSSPYIDPPKYSMSYQIEGNIDNEKTRRELDNVISAIERVYHVAPQLTNQRVELSNRQAEQLSAATLTTAIQRLSRGRLEEQRATSPSMLKYQTLNRLVEQINKAASRSFADQRVELNPRQVRHFEVAKLNGMIERLGKTRMTDQDWHPPEHILIQDLTHLTNELTESSANSAYAAQRFQLTPAKERDMFINSVWKKVDKLRAYRLSDQDAESPAQRRERALQELEDIMIRQKMSYTSAMNSQRWSPEKQKSKKQTSGQALNEI